VLLDLVGERLAGDRLDDAPEPVGVDAVLVDGSGIADERRLDASSLPGRTFGTPVTCS